MRLGTEEAYIPSDYDRNGSSEQQRGELKWKPDPYVGHAYEGHTTHDRSDHRRMCSTRTPTSARTKCMLMLVDLQSLHGARHVEGESPIF